MRHPRHFVGKLAAVGMSVVLLAVPTWAAGESAPAQPSAAITPVTDPGAATAAPDKPKPAFTDIQGHYAQAAIEHLVAASYVSSSGDAAFRPNEGITRQDFAVLLTKAAGLQHNKKEELTYQDVAADSPQAAYVQVLTQAGILKGKTDELFGANDPLTRQDMAVTLFRLMKWTGDKPLQGDTPASFQDESAIADYAKEAVKAVTAKKWMQGSNQKFSPTKHVTRGDAAIIVERILIERQDAAAKATFNVNVEKLSLAAGTSEQVKVTGSAGAPLPFTPVFSFDHTDIGRILPDGTFIAGPTAGKGQITVTVGYTSKVIPVEITLGAREDGQSGGDKGTAGKEANAQAKGADVGQPKADASKTDGAKSDGAPAEDGTRSTDSAAADEDKADESPVKSKDELTNYAPDSTFSIKTSGQSDTYFSSLEKAYPGPVGGLVKPSDTWTGYVRQFGREATAALPKPTTIQQVQLTFLQDLKQGIVLPPEMEVEVSYDGKVWQYAGVATQGVSPSDSTKMTRTLAVSFEPVEAQYVRLRFPVKVIVFARNMQILGAEGNGAASKPVIFAPIRSSVSLDDKKAGDRIENMLLAFSGSYGERGLWKQEDFLPFVGYIGQDGVIKDRMFDTILFIPYPNIPSTKAGWEDYLWDIFRPGRQLDALNDAMREYNNRRGTMVLNTAKEKVVLTIPYPQPTQNNFGSVEKDTNSLNFKASEVGEDKAAENRQKAVKWYFEELKKRWKNADYQYLQLEGIYWYHEYIDDAAPQERELIRYTASTVHKEALRFYWIPYYGAAGLSEWKDMWFDYAFLQPNFYSDKEIPVDRVEATLAVANQYGMGIEIEGDERMVRDMRYYRTYYNQLIAAHKLGIDKDKIHAYYYGSKSLLEAYYSKDPKSRAVYDETYEWMRGRFNQTEYLVPEVPPAP